jgi:hypothetical protein
MTREPFVVACDDEGAPSGFGKPDMISESRRIVGG